MPKQITARKKINSSITCGNRFQRFAIAKRCRWSPDRMRLCLRDKTVAELPSVVLKDTASHKVIVEGAPFGEQRIRKGACLWVFRRLYVARANVCEAAVRPWRCSIAQGTRTKTDLRR